MLLFSGDRQKRRKHPSNLPYYPPTGTHVTHPSPPPPYADVPRALATQQPTNLNEHITQPRPATTVPVLSTRHPPQSPPNGLHPLWQQTWGSDENLHTATTEQITPGIPDFSTNKIELFNTIDDKFSEIVSLIDEGQFHGDERDLEINVPQRSSQARGHATKDGKEAERALFKYGRSRPGVSITQADRAVNVFLKLDAYMNSRLPLSLPPMRFYMPTYPLLCLAAQYSENAYLSPQSRAERKDFVSADGHLGTKAMVIKSVPCDDRKTLVFAIRGTSMLSLRDWGVNLATDLVSPADFLDDPGNLCHAGFLRVAKAMVKPIATRLRSLLDEDRSRTDWSVLITGHSAGGAVASLLYSHMLSSTVQSELSGLTQRFKRVHCVTFGAPPVSLLPLQKPDRADRRLQKCLFHSFINEGDPVVRADKAYVKSLIDLLLAPHPTKRPGPPRRKLKPTATLNALGTSTSRLDLALKPKFKTNVKAIETQNPVQTRDPVAEQFLLGTPRNTNELVWWDTPPGTLSNAGRLVVLRVPPPATSVSLPPQNQKIATWKQTQARNIRFENLDQVTANLVTDEQLRQCIFGDPLVHGMDVYRRRIEALAIRAVTGQLHVLEE